MASIKVKFRPSSVKGREGHIYYQVIHLRKIRQIPTDFIISPSEWDASHSSVCCGQDHARSAYLKSIKDRIRVDMDRFGRIIRRLECQSLEFSADEIVEEYRKSTDEGWLFVYMDRIIADLKGKGKIRSSETYRAAYISFNKFRGGYDIMMESITGQMMEQYEVWLRQQNISTNTISFYMRILRAVYRRAVAEELTQDRHPFIKVSTGVEKTVKRALPLKMIKKIKRLDLSLRPELEYARDMFLLSFMLRGMSLVDMANLKKTDLSGDLLTYRRSKTGQLLTVRWIDEMQSIIDRYPVNGSPYLLPIIRNKDSIALYASRNAGYKINRELKEIGRMLNLPLTLTMYVARHSWASAAKAKGIPLSVISEGLGHDSEKTTMIYLASLDGSVVDRANALLLKELT